MTINENCLAPCGLYCGVCGVFFATRDNNEKFLEKLLGVYQGKIPGLDHLTAEDLKCEGCLSDRVSFFCRVCAIKDCTREKGYEGCHECDDFPCGHIDNFPMPVGKRVILRAIPHWREHGTEKWVADEEARYHCPQCDNTIFRGAQRCNQCKTPLDLD
jgi:Protein of unknown function (DUF3795)